MRRFVISLSLLLLMGACASDGAGDQAATTGKPPATTAPDSTTSSTLNVQPPTTTEPAANGSPLPAACGEIVPPYPDAFELPEQSEVVAQFPFADGVVVLYRQDQPSVTYFGVLECFTGGGAGFSGGGPGESWQGGSRVDYSDAGYAIVVVEDPASTAEVGGQSVEMVSAGEVRAGLVEGFFDRPPAVVLTAEG